MDKLHVWVNILQPSAGSGFIKDQSQSFLSLQLPRQLLSLVAAPPDAEDDAADRQSQKTKRLEKEQMQHSDLGPHSLAELKLLSAFCTLINKIWWLIWFLRPLFCISQHIDCQISSYICTCSWFEKLKPGQPTGVCPTFISIDSPSVLESFKPAVSLSVAQWPISLALPKFLLYATVLAQHWQRALLWEGE